MTLVPLSTLLRHAHKNGYAIPAFNISFQEQAQAILDAATETQSPVIIQLSTGGLKHASTWMVDGLIQHIKKSPLPICLHRDHCHSLDDFQAALELGFSSIMMDGSLTADGKPNAFEENVRITQQALDMAKSYPASVEGELGCLGSLITGLSGEEDGTQAADILSLEQLLTDPSEARDFVAQANVDALAIAIGTSHGAYKFSAPPTESVLNIQRVSMIAEAIPNTPLVLHGSSSVPQDLLTTINQHGGAIDPTFGVPVAAIQKAIQHGVAKVNIDTDLRLAATAAVRQHLNEHPEEMDPRKYLSASRAAMKEICISRYQAFRAAGQAPFIQKTQHDPFTTEVS
ncbi:ketose-bisphosphate aldolase [Candidatus Synchoanobacter obligatus]|uniref:Ketose-bisphosphate aldolase n=1 Tax=Candidatus Synchoanobacter obligatus TaxID=2919597 RepID=A0ABT1L5M7_9GAMM|nr:ketose-bisphosphate aldolase [Candidatus Synchoanobacter obligatus]MCP8352178.1 ketose-bisphosphate aldolase [Candidatus Synchoanobacter obligatus]